MPYGLDYSPDAEGHLRALTARQRATVLDAILAQLTHEPLVATRNRKPMLPNPVATWELRLGDLRVYYDVTETPAPMVHVNAIGIKERNQIRIGGEVVEL